MSLLKNFFFGGNGFSSRSFLQKTNQEILIYGILAILLSFFSHFSQLKIKCFFLFLHFQHNIYSLHIFCWILIKLLYWFLLLYYYFILLLDYILIGYWIGLFDGFFTSFTCFTPFKAIILTIFAFFTILAFHTIFTLHKRISTRESKELFISLTRSTNLKEYLVKRKVALFKFFGCFKWPSLIRLWFFLNSSNFDWSFWYLQTLSQSHKES